MSETAKALSRKRETDGRRDLNTLVGYQLRRVGARAVKELGQIFSVVDLAPGQFSVLMLVSENDGCTQSDLAAITGVDRSTLVPVINRLRSLGYVKRSQSNEDRRAYHLHVSARGETAIGKVMPDLRLFETKITTGLGVGDKKQLLRALKFIESAMINPDEAAYLRLSSGG